MSKKPTEKDGADQRPDAWERFERAVDVVIKAKPKHRPATRGTKEKQKPRK